MFARAVVLSCLLLGVASEDNATDSCALDYRLSSNTNITVNITQDCKEKPCIAKCCRGDRIFLIGDGYSNVCANFTFLEEKYEFKPNYSLIEIYNKDIKERDALIAENVFYEDFVILYNTIFFNDICSHHLFNAYKDSEEWYILEDGTLVRRAFNYANQWFQTYNAGEFCVELLIKANEGKLMSKDIKKVIYVINREDAEEKKDTNRDQINAYSFLVSSVFMALVLLVYALLPELRNLMGLMLMAYLAATIVFYLARNIFYFANKSYILDTRACSVMMLIYYYSMLSSCAWLNVISFNIWWKLRKSVPVTTKGRLDRNGRTIMPKQFWWYHLYGWGLPLVLTVFVIAVDLLDLRHIPSFVKPHIFKPDSCFFGAAEYWLYMTIPLMTLTLANLILFVMTASSIWRIRRNVEAIGSTSTSRNTGIKTYITLSLVMGVTWMFEPLSLIVLQDSWLWYISDAYNLFAGFFMFVVLVCKKKVFLSLCKKFSINNAFVSKLRASEPSTFATDQQRSMHSTVCATTSVDVNAHPAGKKEP